MGTDQGFEILGDETPGEYVMAGTPTPSDRHNRGLSDSPKPPTREGVNLPPVEGGNESHTDPKVLEKAKNIQPTPRSPADSDDG